MSYKHNNLLAMREQYWSDEQSPQVQQEKTYFCHLLQELDVYSNPTTEDAKYLFFNLPSIVIVKGYALGFQDPQVYDLILRFIEQYKVQLAQKSCVKIQYKM
jgi:hypothetical protein